MDMRSARKRVLIGAACIGLGLAAGPAPAGAKLLDNSKDVVVQNTSANPVPTLAQGTTPVSGTINVGNLPANQQVNGTVNVGNLPANQQVNGTVNVGNLPLENGKVAVTSSATPTPVSGTILYSALTRNILGEAAPGGVVITDVVVYMNGAFHPSSAACQGVDMFNVNVNDNSRFATFIPRLTANETGELHLETGVLSADDDPIVFHTFDPSGCVTTVTWTGYAIS